MNIRDTIALGSEVFIVFQFLLFSYGWYSLSTQVSQNEGTIEELVMDREIYVAEHRKTQSIQREIIANQQRMIDDHTQILKRLCKDGK